ncbi:MAG: reprolysin-like metallopeptidase [Pseudolabrys sp.]
MQTNRSRGLISFVSAVFIVAGAVLAAASPAAAQALFLPATTADASAAAAQPVPFISAATRNRVARINRSALTRHVAPAGNDLAADRAARASALDGVLILNLFPDVSATFNRTGVTEQDSGGYIWEGAVRGQGAQEALLLVDDNQVVGHVQLGSNIYRIDPVAGDVYRITEINQAAFPPEGLPLTPPGGTRGQITPQRETAESAVQPAVATTITVLVAYTNTALTEAGSVATMNNTITMGVALANQAYTRGKTAIKLVLAGKMKVNYAEGSDFSVDLNDLTTGAKLAAVRTKRQQLHADLVTLFRKNDASLCGLGWLPGNGIMPTPGPSTTNLGFQVVNWTCVTGNYSWHHEMGHNMGLNHDRYEYNLEGGGNPAAIYYNFGYVNLPKLQRTVMAYNNQCAAAGKFCTRINWFSSGTIKATGNVVIGKSKGVAGAADNSTRLKQDRVAISHYR